MPKQAQTALNESFPRGLLQATRSVTAPYRRYPAATYPAYCTDESRFSASDAEWVVLPESIAQLAGVLQDCATSHTPCVVSGGRTGVAGGAVPQGAAIVISLERLQRVLAFGRDADGAFLRCEAGLPLSALTEFLSTRRIPLEHLDPASRVAAEEYQNRVVPELWLPVNPTETGAQIGGMVATNASGSRTYRYGPVRNWVRALRVVLPGGEELTLRRGNDAVCADGRQFQVRHTDGTVCAATLPEIPKPATKCTCGYQCVPDMELIDLFIGSEGTLAAIAEVELRLEEKPVEAAGVLVFLDTEQQVLQLVKAMRDAGDCAAIEYFDRDSLVLVGASFPGKYPQIPKNNYGVYFEFRGDSAAVSAALQTLTQQMGALGLDLYRSWAEDQAEGCERLREFRHALPEAVNQLIARRKANCPALHKVGTDMAVPYDQFSRMLSFYRQSLIAAGLESVVFGHIGDGHVHVNILPRNEAELAAAKEMYQAWAGQAVELGGTVAAEHGIGRLKKKLLLSQYPSGVVESFLQIRYCFDAGKILGCGILC